MLYDKNGNAHIGPVKYDSMGNPKDHFGNYLSYTAKTTTYQPSHKPSKSSTTNRKPSYDYSGGSGGGGGGGGGGGFFNTVGGLFLFGVIAANWKAMLGFVATTAAVTGVTYATYKTSKWALKKRGHKRFLGLKAAGITTSAAGALVGSMHVYNQLSYPSMSIAVGEDMFKPYIAEASFLGETATSAALKKCEEETGKKCSELAVTNAGRQACFAYTVTNSQKREYLLDIFSNKINDTHKRKLECLSRKQSSTSVYCKPITTQFFCNSDRLTENAKALSTIELALLFNAIKTSKTLEKPAALPPTKRPLNSAAIAANPSTPPIYAEEQDRTSVPAPALRSYFRVTASTLNIRSAPGTSAAIEDQLNQGSCVSVRQGDRGISGFIEIMAESARGRKIDGYVSAQYLTPVPGAPAACIATFK